MQDYQKSFIDFLLECGAFKLGSFTLKSGRSSPTFLNTGLVTNGRGIHELGRAYAGSLLDNVGADHFDSVFGPSYKGVPLAVATAIALAEQGIVKGYLFDRKERKEHGEEAASKGAASVLVGHRPVENERVVIVDDVLTTGATKYDAVKLLGSLVNGVTFPALAIALDRQETGKDGTDACSKFTEDTGIPVLPAVKMTQVLDHMEATGRLPDEERGRCLNYLAEYGTPEAREWVAGRR